MDMQNPQKTRRERQGMLSGSRIVHHRLHRSACVDTKYRICMGIGIGIGTCVHKAGTLKNESKQKAQVQVNAHAQFQCKYRYKYKQTQVGRERGGGFDGRKEEKTGEEAKKLEGRRGKGILTHRKRVHLCVKGGKAR